MWSEKIRFAHIHVACRCKVMSTCFWSMLTFRTCGMPRYRREGAWARQGNRDSRYLSTLVVSPEIERDQDHSKCGYRRKPFLGPAETRSSARTKRLGDSGESRRMSRAVQRRATIII